MALQKKFIESKGEPVEYEGDLMIQMDRIPIKKGKVRIKFLGGNSELTCGVALKSTKGGITLSNGKKVRLLHIWDEENLPDIVGHWVECPDGQLKIWNIYRIPHKNGGVTEEAWTNNACMNVIEVEAGRRLYKCSDGAGGVDIGNQLFELTWDAE